MLTFDPPNLEAAFRAAVDRIETSFTVMLEGSALESDFDTDSEGDVTISGATELALDLPRTDDDPVLSVEEFIALSTEVTNPTSTCDGLTYHSPSRTIVRLKSWDVRSMSFAERVGDDSGLGAQVTTELAGHPVSIGLRAVSPHFAAAIVVKDLFYDKYNPPLTGDEVFVEVVHSQGATTDAANALIQAYIFELQASLGLEYFEWPRPDGDEIEYPEDEEIDDLVGRARSLRPLLVGQGLPAVLAEFNAGHSAGSNETSLLAYVKCIEYVSATVVREKQYEDLRKRLLSKEALSPNADFMDGLMVLFEENRSFTRDTEALRLSLERCCDPLPMAAHAPKLLRNLAGIRPSSNIDQRKVALVELATTLSASRNQMAHAKANYRPTGKECPPEQLVGLVACARIAAEQCIRWYASRSEELRRG